MTATSFAIVTIRILALAIIIYNCFTILVTFAAQSELSSMANRGNFGSLNVSVTGQRSSINSILSLQYAISFITLVAGIMLYRNSGFLGRFISKDLP